MLERVNFIFLLSRLEAGQKKLGGGQKTGEGLPGKKTGFRTSDGIFITKKGPAGRGKENIVQGRMKKGKGWILFIHCPNILDANGASSIWEIRLYRNVGRGGRKWGGTRGGGESVRGLRLGCITVRRLQSEPF